MWQFMKRWHQAFKEDRALRPKQAPIVEPGYAIAKDLLMSCFDEERIKAGLDHEFKERRRKRWKY